MWSEYPILILNLSLKYLIEIKNSIYQLNIYPHNINNHFSKTIFGSFIYDNSVKYSISQINIFADTKSILDFIVLGFLQKTQR